MDKNIDSSQNTNTDCHNKGDKKYIKELITKIWHKRKFVIICTTIFILLGFIVALTSPVSYTANCTVVPQSGDQKNNRLGGIASMIGVNLASTMTSETLSPFVYPQIIKSVPFCKEIMETPIIVKKSNGKAITLYEYYTDKNYSKVNVLGIIKKYTIDLPGFILSSLKPDKETTIYTDTITGQMITLSKKEQDVIKAIISSIQFSSNPQEGYIVIGYSFSEPQPTAIIAQNVYNTLEKYVKNYKTQKQLDNLEFVENSYKRTRKDFMEKQAALASFQDSNRDLTSAIARTTERRLISEYEVAYTVYNELAVQLEQSKISVKESTPILIVIDPVVVPNEKSGPRRAYILIVFFLLGLSVAIGWIFAKPPIQDVISGLKQNEAS